MASFGSVVGWIFGVLAVMIIGILIWNVLIPMFSTNFAQNCDNLSLGDLIAQRLYDFYEIMEVMIEDVDDLPPSNVVSNDISNFIYTAFQKHLMDHHNMQV